MLHVFPTNLVKFIYDTENKNDKYLGTEGVVFYLFGCLGVILTENLELGALPNGP